MTKSFGTISIYQYYSIMTVIISVNNWIIFTICEQIIAKCCFGVPHIPRIIGIDKPTGLRIVVSGLEIVQAGFRIEVIRSVAVGVHRGNAVCAGIGYNGAFAPCVIPVPHYRVAVCIGNGENVALEVLYEIIRCAVVEYTAYCAAVRGT